MTIQDQLLKKITKKKQELFDAIDDLTKQPITDSNPVVKPTRYYPNGAYMDEPEEETYYFYLPDYEGVGTTNFVNFGQDVWRINTQNCFPTKEAAEKELNRQKLTAKMYRDMQDERINGDWVADYDNDEEKYEPYLDEGGDLACYSDYVRAQSCHGFQFKNETFIEDLKALGWTEEELKIVWFRV